MLIYVIKTCPLLPSKALRTGYAFINSMIVSSTFAIHGRSVGLTKILTKCWNSPSDGEGVQWHKLRKADEAECVTLIILRYFLLPSEYGKVSLVTVLAHFQADRLPSTLSLTNSRHLSHSIRHTLTYDLAINATASYSLVSIFAASFTCLHKTSAFP
jgi:hypothetical protein